MHKRRMAVLGLDGASFELIAPWIEEGSLPGFARMKESGCWGDMMSCLPPVTSPNWKCYSTGMNPGNLGVFWWESVDVSNRRITRPNAASFKYNTEIWDYLSEAGLRVGVINTPTTYPPKKVNGVLVSGGPDAIDRGYTYPPELEGTLREKYGYRVHPDSPETAGPGREAWVSEVMELSRSRFRLGFDLLDEGYDFVQITLFYLNSMQHFLWDSEEVKELWKAIDGYLSRLLDMPELTVLIMSDHGSNRIETTFYINNWLEQNGYLVLKKAAPGRLAGLGLTRERLRSAATALGVRGFLKRVLPVSFTQLFPTGEGEVMKEAKAGMIDWDASTFVASGQGPIYCLKPERAGELCDELARKLAGLEAPGVPGKAFANVYRKSDIYWGDHTDSAPDIVLDQGKGLHINGSVGSETVFGKPERWAAENKLYGMFMCSGPGVRRGVNVEGVKIIDLAPTVVYSMTGRAPALDGRVLTEIFEEAGTVEYTERGDSGGTAGDDLSSDEDEEVARRLQDLGYI